MKSISAYLNEDSNQFGPGTDLMVSLLAVLLVMTLVTSQLYSREKSKNEQVEGTFRVATESFLAGDFHSRPVTRLVDPGQTEERVRRIVQEYHAQEFGYIFVVGHSNSTDDPHAEDPSPRARKQRNFEYAGRRAALIASMLEEHLTHEERDRLVVLTTGELDMRNPSHPESMENAWVEVVFGRDWKLPARATAE